MGDRVTRKLIWLLVTIVAFFLIAAIVQWLWNCIIPWVIGFPPVTYWQAAGILLLTHILFGGLARMFTAGCGSGCSCGCGSKVPDAYLSEDRTGAMDTIQRAEYDARSRAFLEKTDDLP